MVEHCTVSSMRNNALVYCVVLCITMLSHKTT